MLQRPAEDSAKIEHETSLYLAAINFVKGFINLVKFACLTLNPCSPCGMQLKRLSEIYALSDEGSLDRSWNVVSGNSTLIRLNKLAMITGMDMHRSPAVLRSPSDVLIFRNR